MPGESYTIDAQLRLNARGATNELQTFASRLQRVGRVVSGTSTGIVGMVAGVAGLTSGVAIVGTLIAGFERLTAGAVAYQTTMEGLELQTAAVMGAVDRIPFDRARTAARELFQQYRTDAIASVATTEQLVMISNAIMGPLRGAGQSMAVVRDMTNATVTASTALGVDLAQASRDMQLMINGSAGMHVRLYQMLHATGAIAEDAHAFNQLTNTERIARLQSALGRFQGAATAYGNSFAGATSTFQDIVDNLTSTFYGPAFDRLRQFLLDVNQRLISNRTAIEGVLTRAGTWFADHVQVAFDAMLNGMDYVGEHWDEIVTKGEAFVARIREVLPQIVAAAKAWAALSLARSIVGGGVSGVGGLLSMLGGGGGAAAATGAATLAVSSSASRFETALAEATPALGALASGGGVAGAAATEDMFAAAAARAAATAPLGGIGVAVAPVAASAATGLEAVVAALSPIAVIAIPVAAAIALVGSVIYAVSEHFDYFSGLISAMMPLVSKVGGDLMAIAGDLWAAVAPIFELIGFTTANNAVGSLASFLSTLHQVLLGVRRFTEGLRDLGNWLSGHISPDLAIAEDATQMYVEALSGVPNAAASAAAATDELNAHWRDLLAETSVGRDIGGSSSLRTRFLGGGMTQQFGAFTGVMDPLTHREQAPPVFDFRGSRITQNMEFREADPDRVMMQSMEDLQRMAESRVASGLSGLGR